MDGSRLVLKMCHKWLALDSLTVLRALLDATVWAGAGQTCQLCLKAVVM